MKHYLENCGSETLKVGTLPGEMYIRNTKAVGTLPGELWIRNEVRNSVGWNNSFYSILFFSQEHLFQTSKQWGKWILARHFNFLIPISLKLDVVYLNIWSYELILLDAVVKFEISNFYTMRLQRYRKQKTRVHSLIKC